MDLACILHGACLDLACMFLSDDHVHCFRSRISSGTSSNLETACGVTTSSSSSSSLPPLLHYSHLQRFPASSFIHHTPHPPPTPPLPAHFPPHPQSSYHALLCFHCAIIVVVYTTTTSWLKQAFVLWAVRDAHGHRSSRLSHPLLLWMGHLYHLQL